jgi:hypothetical protein
MPLHATLFQKNPTHQSAIIQKKYTKKSGGGSFCPDKHKAKAPERRSWPFWLLRLMISSLTPPELDMKNSGVSWHFMNACMKTGPFLSAAGTCFPAGRKSSFLGCA